MAQPAAAFVTRRSLRSLPRVTASSQALASPTAHSSTRSYASRAPALADVGSQNAPAFEAKQKEFRERQAAMKAKEDRESAMRASPSASRRLSVHDEAAATESQLNASAAEDIASNLGLGSLSNAMTGDAREAARKKEAEESSNASYLSVLRSKGPLATIIYGTEEGRQMDREIERSYSQVLARGKYVHSVVFHEVKPDKVDEYIELVGGWYPKVASNPAHKVHLVGSWRTEVGDCDTFVHIWEYQRYHGYHDSLHSIQHDPGFPEFDHKLKTLINSKRTSLMQEFSFWPTTPPRKLGGVFELRSYTLHPGNLLEWESHWRKGLEARREVMEGVGAWFVQVGDLNTVHHLWQFADMEERKVQRELSWGIEGWADTVHKTVPLVQSMKSRILVPMPWSPVG